MKQAAQIIIDCPQEGSIIFYIINLKINDKGLYEAFVNKPSGDHPLWQATVKLTLEYALGEAIKALRHNIAGF